MHSINIINNMNDNQDIVMRLAQLDYLNDRAIQFVFGDKKRLSKLKNGLDILSILIKSGKSFNDYVIELIFNKNLDSIKNNLDIFEECLKIKNRDSRAHQDSVNIELIKTVFSDRNILLKIKENKSIFKKILEITFGTDKAMYPYESWVQDIFDDDEIFARIMEAPDVCCRLLEKLPGSYLVMEILSDQKFYTNIIENKWLLDELLILNDGAGVLKRIFKDYSDDAEGHISGRLKLIDRNILYSILKAPNINTHDKSNIIRTILDNRSTLSKIQNNQQVFNTVLKSKNCGQYFIEFIFSNKERLCAFTKELSKAKSKDLNVVPTELVSVALSNVLMTQQTVEV